MRVEFHVECRQREWFLGVTQLSHNKLGKQKDFAILFFHEPMEQQTDPETYQKKMLPVLKITLEHNLLFITNNFSVRPTIYLSSTIHVKNYVLNTIFIQVEKDSKSGIYF